MSIPNDSEEKIRRDKLRPLAEEIVNELRALAEKRGRQAKLASKARGGSNQAKAKRREVSEKDLLALGGKKAGRDDYIRLRGRNPACLQAPKEEG